MPAVDWKLIVATLQAKKIPFVLTGAHGLAVWLTQPRATKDVDILVKSGRNYQRAVKAIEGFFVGDLGLGPWEILILMQLSFIIMGMFLDDTAMLVIVAPLYVPLVGSLGFDLVWYGVLYTITCQIAYMTPPFGYNLFLMRAMAPPEVSLGDIYRSVTPFVAIMALTLVLVMIYPQIALWLPQWHYGG